MPISERSSLARVGTFHRETTSNTMKVILI